MWHGIGVSFEPGEFAFPDDDVPDVVTTQSPLLASFMAPQIITAAEFSELTRIPILIVLGDNIATVPDEDYGLELWRLVRERAHQFVASVNSRGGNATSTTCRIADLVSDFLGQRGLALRPDTASSVTPPPAS